MNSERQRKTPNPSLVTNIIRAFLRTNIGIDMTKERH
jgi:hypothetical protein